jgi:hypothetical protein
LVVNEYYIETTKFLGSDPIGYGQKIKEKVARQIHSIFYSELGVEILIY